MSFWCVSSMPSFLSKASCPLLTYGNNGLVSRSWYWLGGPGDRVPLYPVYDSATSFHSDASAASGLFETGLTFFSSSSRSTSEWRVTRM